MQKPRQAKRAAFSSFPLFFALCVFVFICSATAFKNFALQIFFDDDLNDLKKFSTNHATAFKL
jgi:hypothetical protein